MGLRMSVAAMDLAIVRLEAGTAVPAWAMAGEFFSITRTPDELSVVAEHTRIPSGTPADGEWCALKVEGPAAALCGRRPAFDHRTAGRAGISIFAVSTHDTDYLLVKAKAMGRAVRPWRRPVTRWSVRREAAGRRPRHPQRGARLIRRLRQMVRGPLTGFGTCLKKEETLDQGRGR